MASSNFITQAIEIVKQAIDADQKGEYENALGYYKKSLDYFMAGLKYEKKSGHEGNDTSPGRRLHEARRRLEGAQCPVGGRGRFGGRQGGLEGGGDPPRQISPALRRETQALERHPTLRPARDRKVVFSQGRRHRGRLQILLCLFLRPSQQVAGRERALGAFALRDGSGGGPGHHIHRRSGLVVRAAD
ncbi:putative vps4-vacuolar sorting protein [Nannochloropsis gaditana]|uniref:Putative vps4-vacuolar sorting protein n=1 Tax=Nannochloropsis gaditana TaxID=72520 RepID=W7TX84_9STRA|nr:putative vps4-vacuolar sorting protein [Nannochloropsis gaditana]